MHLPIRVLREQVDDLHPEQRALSPREQERQHRIFSAAQMLLARHGRHALTFTGVAAALRIAPATLRRHAADLDELLMKLLEQHFRTIFNAIGKVSQSEPGLHARRRAAYLAHTRKPFGGFTEPHLLLIRERHTLPPDLLDHIERLYADLANLLAGPAGPAAMDLLDSPSLTPDDIEALLPILLRRLQAQVEAQPGATLTMACSATTPPGGPAEDALQAREMFAKGQVAKGKPGTPETSAFTLTPQPKSLTHRTDRSGRSAVRPVFVQPGEPKRAASRAAIPGQWPVPGANRAAPAIRGDTS